MKIVLQAIATSMIIHVIYFVCVTVFAYVKTKNYESEHLGQGGQIDLQDEVVFGVIVSPSSIIFSLVGVAAVCGIILVLYKKITSLRA